MAALIAHALVVVGMLNPDAGSASAESAARIPATIRVKLPADAKLTINDQPTQSTTSSRVFVSPPLEIGKMYHYTLSAQFMRDGKTITADQDVAVSAGRETVVSLGVAGLRDRSSRKYAYGSITPPVYCDEGSLQRCLTNDGFHPTHWGIDPADHFFPNSSW